MKRFTSVFIAFFMLFVLFTNDVHAEASPIIQKKNHVIPGSNFVNLNDKIDELKTLDEGTIIVRFRPDSSGITSLFSLSNNNLANGHFHLYVSGSAIGLENRYEEPGQPSGNIHVKADVTVKENEVHTLAIVLDKEEGYKYFLNGKQVLHDTTTERKFLSNIYQPNSARLGETERSGNHNGYPFKGAIDFAEVYSTPLSDEDLIHITGITTRDNLPEQVPDGMITAPDSVFYPDLYESKAYRIPALYHTMDETLIAGIDKRIDHAGDSPANIDMMVRRSLDQGNTWEDNGIMVNEYPGGASNIDQSLLQDGQSGRIFSLVDSFPEGGGFPTAKKGTGYTLIDDKQYMTLYDEAEKEYTIREDGIVYDTNNQKTNYTVDQKRNLYENGDKISNIFLKKSPLKVAMTSFLELWHSDDDGETWKGPVDVNPGIKEEWMAFLGTGPGNGIQLTQGDQKNRLVFPVYFTNEKGSQASAVIYSDDQGETWERGESPNHERVVNGDVLDEKTFQGNEITESQVVEMPDGQLKLFMRNYSGFAQIATSFDGGETWDSEVITEQDLVAPYSQMTAIRYDGQIDGHEAVIFASAGESNSRVNGTVRAGLIKEEGNYDNGRKKYIFDWKYSQLVKEGAYGYSSLTNLKDGHIGLFYENGSKMDFIKFDVDYLKWEREENLPLPSLDSISVEFNEEEEYFPGDEIQVKAVFNDYIMLSGDKSLSGNIGDVDMELSLKEEDQIGREFMFEGEIPELDPGEYTLQANFSDNLDIRNVYGKKLDVSNELNKLSSKVNVKNEIDEDDVLKAKLKDEIGKATQFTNEDGTYTSSSFAALEEAIKAAEEVLGEIESADDLKTALAALQSAVDGLEASEPGPDPDPEPVDVAELEKLIETAKEKTNEDGTYTSSSFATLEEAIKAAEGVLGEIESAEELESALAALQLAIDGLEASDPEPDPERVDVTELEKLIETAKEKTNKDGAYTSSSFAILEEAIKAAEEVLGEIESAEDLETALAVLQSAIDGLEASESDVTVPKKEESDQNKKLPSTATNNYTILLIGLACIMLGIVSYIVVRRKKFREDA